MAGGLNWLFSGGSYSHAQGKYATDEQYYTCPTAIGRIIGDISEVHEGKGGLSYTLMGGVPCDV